MWYHRLVLSASWASKPAAGTSEATAFASYLDEKVVFHNTMVDRITSHREGNALVPRTEPWPTKTLVIEDLRGVLASTSLASQEGVVVRTSQGELEQDHTLKLSVANHDYTAVVYLLAFSRTRACASTWTRCSKKTFCRAPGPRNLDGRRTCDLPRVVRPSRAPALWCRHVLRHTERHVQFHEPHEIDQAYTHLKLLSRRAQFNLLAIHSLLMH